jgi:putative phosphoesterase
MMTERIGVISDTHGLLREQAKDRLQGCDLIVHAGDVGGPDVLAQLRQIAEIVAVRGNTDKGEWARELPEMECLDVAGTQVVVVHDRSTLAHDALPSGTDVVIYGHSHKPHIESLGGILYLNPGSAGPRRFDLPVTMALLHLGSDGVRPEIVQLPA